ncbi:MAG: hypothetical protein ABEH81_00995 [Halopenitus sp.]
MHEETQETLNDIIDILEDNGYTVTHTEFTEYSWGKIGEGYDEVDKLSAEVDVTVEKIIKKEEDENDFRVK